MSTPSRGKEVNWKPCNSDHLHENLHCNLRLAYFKLEEPLAVRSTQKIRNIKVACVRIWLPFPTWLDFPFSNAYLSIQGLMSDSVTNVLWWFHSHAVLRNRAVLDRVEVNFHTIYNDSLLCFEVLTSFLSSKSRGSLAKLTRIVCCHYHRQIKDFLESSSRHNKIFKEDMHALSLAQINLLPIHERLTATRWKPCCATRRYSQIQSTSQLWVDLSPSKLKYLWHKKLVVDTEHSPVDPAWFTRTRQFSGTRWQWESEEETEKRHGSTLSIFQISRWQSWSRCRGMLSVSVIGSSHGRY